ncbi:hypothetical protein MZM54_02705 [[Brevibacterium] frigoritolerans]|nr:hypothetical protein [Peribacillus frigoritolerans]
MQPIVPLRNSLQISMQKYINKLKRVDILFEDYSLQQFYRVYDYLDIHYERLKGESEQEVLMEIIAREKMLGMSLRRLKFKMSPGLKKLQKLLWFNYYLYYNLNQTVLTYIDSYEPDELKESLLLRDHLTKLLKIYPDNSTELCMLFTNDLFPVFEEYKKKVLPLIEEEYDEELSLLKKQATIRFKKAMSYLDD